MISELHTRQLDLADAWDCTNKAYRDHDAGSQVRACMYEISLLLMPNKFGKSIRQCVVCALINDPV